MATSKLYRSKNGEWFGICQGIANWRDLPVGIVRLIVILVAVFTAIVPCLLIYLLLGFIIPIDPYENAPDGFQDDFENLKDRVNRMERKEKKHEKESDWDARFHS